MPGAKRTGSTVPRKPKASPHRQDPLYRLLHRVMMDAFVGVDMTGRVTDFNGEFVTMLGYSPAELRTKMVEELTPEKWHAAESKIIHEQVLARGYSDIYEKEFRKKDGSILPVELRTALLRDRSNRAVGMWTVIRDCTMHKEFERRLLQSEEKFGKAFHLSPDAVNINRLADGLFLAVNDGFMRTTGYTEADVVGRSSLPGGVGLWVNPEDRERLVAGLRTRGEVLNLEAPFRMKDGTIRSGVMSARVIQFGGESCILSVTRDITERKRHEESLRTSEERMRAIIEGTPHLFFYTQDMHANTTYVSPTVEAITGYPPDVWVKQRDWFITGSEINRGAKDATHAHLRGESTPLPIILEVRHREGRRILLEVYEHPVIRDGRAMGLQGVAHDVTERMRAEEEIVRSLREKEVMLKEIHHRVKNNLQIISSMLSMQALEATEAPVRDALEEARSRVRSMALVHEKLYTVSDLSKVDLCQYAASLAASLARSWMRPEIRVTVGGEETSVGVDTAIPCGLILNELLTNAFKHAFAGREGGEVNVSVRPRGETEVEIRVEDDGVGIPAGKEFTTAASMGMNLVRDLVEQLSGTVTLDRSHGACFVILFPK